MWYCQQGLAEAPKKLFNCIVGRGGEDRIHSPRNSPWRPVPETRPSGIFSTSFLSDLFQVCPVPNRASCCHGRNPTFTESTTTVNNKSKCEGVHTAWASVHTAWAGVHHDPEKYQSSLLSSSAKATPSAVLSFLYF